MSLLKKFFMVILCAMPCVAAGNVATTVGSNLTAWNGDSAATNNNNWNQLMNNRTQATGAVGAKPKADFGNCNSLILRCAQPKCSGCTTMDIARSIVQGCVNSNETCKKHGDDLVEFISAQIVADANARVQQQQIAAQSAAAQAAAAQNNAQLQQMQQQMQQMQYDMQQQNAAQMQQMQAALEEQKALTAQAQAAATAQANAANAAAAQDNMGLTNAQIQAAEQGVDADVLARQKISGQILSRIENAEVALKQLNTTMQGIFTYAGCDTRGNNCSGPKRVKVFKQKAMGFFEPYDTIVDEAYEALEMALAVGVDVSDVIMMLSGACNQWGKFICTSDGSNKNHVVGQYDDRNCPNGRSVKGPIYRYGSPVGSVKGGMECTVGMAIPAQDDSRCTLTELIGGSGENGEVLESWIDEGYDTEKFVRVGCATSALESIAIFGRRSSRNGATLDLDTLERIISQDAPEYSVANRYSQGGNTDMDRLKYCAITSEDAYQKLVNAVNTKKLPKQVCTTTKGLERNFVMGGGINYMASFADSSLSQYVGGARTKELCDKTKAWVTVIADGCGVEWNPGEERCKVSGDGCGYDSMDGVVKKKNAKSGAASTTYQNSCSEISCKLAGGILNNQWGACCKCGAVVFDTTLYKCDNGKLVDKWEFKAAEIFRIQGVTKSIFDNAAKPSLLRGATK